MIVTRAMADDAATLLDLPAEDWTEALIRERYRTAAKRAHPDSEDGSAEKFMKVDRAKHVLLAWLARTPTAETAGAGRVCPDCEGRGYVKLQRGLRAMQMSCPKCRGSGDLDTEHEKGNHY